jgi:MFS family permease
MAGSVEPAPVPSDLNGVAPVEEAPELKGKELRLAVRALDRSDPAVAFARGLRLEGGLFLGGGGAALLGVILGGAVSTGGSDEANARGRLFVAFGMPLALGVVVAAVPGMLTGQRYLEWYARSDGPPSEISRLKLLNRWRRHYLEIRRNTGLIGSAFTGAAALVAGIGWAVADDGEGNGVPSSADYERADALTTLGFSLVTVGLAVTGLITHFQLVRDDVGGHRALTSAQLGLGASPEQDPDGTTGYRVQGSLSFRF